MELVPNPARPPDFVRSAEGSPVVFHDDTSTHIIVRSRPSPIARSDRMVCALFFTVAITFYQLFSQNLLTNQRKCGIIVYAEI